MKYFIGSIFFVLSVCTASQERIPNQKKVTLIKETENLAHCESVIYDSKRKLLYVSVQSEKAPGDGSIATVSLDGKILDAKFISGLNNPKGLAQFGDKLYVSDVTELVEIDLKKEKVVKKYRGKNAKSLNDVAVDKSGNVYVSDMHRSAIYRLDKNKNFKEWFTSAELENPNGLLVVNDKIYVAAWGSYNNDKPIESSPGRFLTLDLKTKNIERITQETLGHLDGLQTFDKKSFILSAWVEGKIFHAYENGKTYELLDTEQGVGDILYLAEQNLLVLPMNKQNKIMFYKVY